MPARSAATGRSLGINALSIACFLVSAWSFAAAALPRVFYGGQIPGYPPLVILQRQIIHGEGRFVGVGLPSSRQAIGAAAVGAVTALVGLLLWKRARIAPYAFLALLWLAPLYYAIAIWRSPYGALARQYLEGLTPGLRRLIWGNLAAAALVAALMSVYVWRRRSRFQ